MKKYIYEFFKELELYEDSHNSNKYKKEILCYILKFLRIGNEKTAYNVYAAFFRAYWIGIQKGDNPFLKLTGAIKRFEESAGRLINYQRDHYIHSVNVFLLGLAIFSTNKEYRNYFRTYALNKKNYPDSYNTKNEEFFFRWGLASLFHDIGYPLEITLRQANEYFDFIWCYPNKIHPKKYSFIDFPHFTEFISLPQLKPSKKHNHKFYQNYPSFKILYNNDCVSLLSKYIASRFNLTLRKVKTRITNYIKSMKKKGFIDHGFYGAVIISRWYYYLMKTTKWNPAYYYFPILDAASAIVLHNFYKNILRKKPFKLDRMKVSQHPIAYLLILCDEIQDWNRKEYGEGGCSKSALKNMNLIVNNQELKLSYNNTQKKRYNIKVNNKRFVVNIKDIFKNGIKIEGGHYG